MRTVEKIVLYDKGDPSVGIPSGYWEVIGHMSFDCQADLEDFRIALAEAWELVVPDRLKILFDYELKELNDFE